MIKADYTNVFTLVDDHGNHIKSIKITNMYIQDFIWAMTILHRDQLNAAYSLGLQKGKSERKDQP